MGNKYVSAYVDTNKNLEQLKADVAGMLRQFGGTLYSTPTGFTLIDGTIGTQMSFTANLTTNVIIRPIKENKYDIQIYLTWNWAALMWIFLVFGLLAAGMPWLLLILYLFFDPAPAYQQALYRLVNFEMAQIS